MKTLEEELRGIVDPIQGFWPRLEQALGVLPGVVIHLLASAAAWIYIQLSGLMVAGCGAARPCNSAVIHVSLNGIQPMLLAVWGVTAVLAVVRPLVWGRYPWPVVGIGFGISLLIAGLDYLALVIGAGLL